jgi:hypothetical protein
LGMRLVNGSLLGDASLTTMWTPPNGLNNYAMGWNTAIDQGTPVVAKNGGQLGAQSYTRIYPEKDIVIVVLSNRWRGGHNMVQLGRDIGTLMLEYDAAQPLPTTPIQFPVDSDKLFEETGELALPGLLPDASAEEDDEKTKSDERNPDASFDPALMLVEMPTLNFTLEDLSPEALGGFTGPIVELADRPVDEDPYAEVPLDKAPSTEPLEGKLDPDAGYEDENFVEAPVEEEPVIITNLLFVPLTQR